MANPFQSASWFSVARLRPQLKSHIRVRRHRYRGNRWYVIDDGAAGKSHRFASGAYRLIGRLNGRRTVEQLWERLVTELGEDAPTQDEVITSLAQLHAADLLSSNALPDTDELLRRKQQHRRQIWVQNLKSPMSLRIPLIDPDAFLSRTIAYVRPLFSWAGALLWLAVVLPAVLIAASNWSELTGNLIDRVLATENLAVLAICYPVVKLLHELGHGYAAKANGRQVREMGVMLLLFVPVPYVDASAASAIRSKGQRALIGAAGMIAELFVAAFAVYAWTLLQPGLARAFAFNVILIAGVSTVLVNGNPLLRFDGYYILADLLEIPNLGSRANGYWGHLVERWIFRAKSAEPFDATPGEKVWLFLYAPLAFVARMLMLFGIALVVARKFFIVGVLMAVWTVWSGVGLPVWKMFAHVFTSPRLHKDRRRAVRLTVGAVVALLLLLFVIPAPHHAYTQGVVWLPEEAHVRAGTDGSIVRVATPEGTPVRRGQLLVETQAPALQSQVSQLEWRTREMQAEADEELGGDLVKRQMSQVGLAEAQERLAIEQQRLGELQVAAGADGRFVAALPAGDLPGRFVHQGDLIGYVTPPVARIARIAVSQDDIDLVRERVHGIRFQLASQPGETWTGQIVRIIPEATRKLPSKGLAAQNGGIFAADPRDAKGETALRSLYLFDIALPPELRHVPFGTRVHVRFQLAWEPLGWQMMRRLRQLFLARFGA